MALAIKGSGAFLRAVRGSWWRCSVRSALLLLWEWPSVFCLWNRLILFLHLILFHFFKTCLFHPKPKSTPDCLYGSYVSPTARLSPSSHSTEDPNDKGNQELINSSDIQLITQRIQLVCHLPFHQEMESWTPLHYSFCVLCPIEFFHISISATLLSRAISQALPAIVIIANITELRQSGHIHCIYFQQKLKPQVNSQCPVMAISVSLSCSFPKVHLLSIFLLACWDHCVGVSVWGLKLISCKGKGVGGWGGGRPHSLNK